MSEILNGRRQAYSVPASLNNSRAGSSQNSEAGDRDVARLQDIPAATGLDTQALASVLAQIVKEEDSDSEANQLSPAQSLRGANSNLHK